METFVCDKCGHLDAVQFAYVGGRLPSDDPTGTVPWLCTICQGRAWHHAFTYAPYRPGFDHGVINREDRYTTVYQ